MGELDIRCAEYFEDNSRFADIMNFRLFDGKQVVVCLLGVLWLSAVQKRTEVRK